MHTSEEQKTIVEIGAETKCLKKWYQLEIERNAWSNIEYLIQAYYIVKLDEKFNLNDGFKAV